MAVDYLYELENAVIKELAEDGALGAVVNGVYDNVPADAKYPFIAVENFKAKSFKGGFFVEFAVDAASGARDSLEAANIAAEIRRIIGGAVLGGEEWNVSLIYEAGYVISRADDGLTWHGTINFAAFLQQGSNFAASGNDFILQIVGVGSTAGVFITIGGLQNASLQLSNKIIDATSLASGKWRKLLPGAGINSVAVSGDGFFTDSAAEQALRLAAFSGSLNNYRILLGRNNYITGKFVVAHYKRVGDMNAQEGYAVSLESGGEVVWG